MSYSDEILRETLRRARVIGIVGVSANPVRPSYFVARYLQRKGYRVIPVNPGLAGQELLGERVRPDLGSVPDAVDMIDIFRRPEAVPAIIAEALARWPALETVWMQLGIASEEGRALAEARGVRVIENRCPKIEYQRLFGELRMGGFATGVISSRL